MSHSGSWNRRFSKFPIAVSLPGHELSKLVGKSPSHLLRPRAAITTHLRSEQRFGGFREKCIATGPFQRTDDPHRPRPVPAEMKWAVHVGLGAGAVMQCGACPADAFQLAIRRDGGPQFYSLGSQLESIPESYYRMRRESPTQHMERNRVLPRFRLSDARAQWGNPDHASDGTAERGRPPTGPVHNPIVEELPAMSPQYLVSLRATCKC